MFKKALVAQIEKSWINLLTIDEEEMLEDESCEASACSTSACSCRVTGRPFRAAHPTEFRVTPGDTVQVSISNSQTLWGFLGVFVIPVLAGILSWFASRRIFPVSSSGVQVLVTLTGVLLTLVLVLMCSPREARLPHIKAVIESGKNKPI